MAETTVKTPLGDTITVKHPEGATDAEILEYAKKNYAATTAAPVVDEAAQPSGAVSALRVPEMAARGFVDSAIGAIGAAPELVSGGMRAVGIPAPEAGFYPQKLHEGYDALGRALSSPINRLLDVTDSDDRPTGKFGPSKPTGTLERGAYGAGRGVADVGAFMVPGAAAAKYGGPVTQAVGRSMLAQPAMQATAGAVGGGVAESTGSDVLGLTAALSVPLGAAALRRGLTPFPSQLSRNEQNLADAAEHAGINLTAGQRTGSPALRTMESSFAQGPLTSRTQNELYSGQRQAFNRAVLRQAGVSADDAGPEVMADAFRNIGREFDGLAAQTTIRPDQQLVDDVANTVHEYGRRLTADVAPVMQSYLDDFARLQANLANNPQIPGTEYQSLASDIRKRARAAGNSPDLQNALHALAGTIDDALERSAGPGLRDAWRSVRNRYRNLLMVDKAMGAGTQADRSAGNVPFSGLRTAVKGADKRGYSRGRGDLNELSRVGDFLGSAVPPDSGTPRRTLMNNLLQLGAGGTGGLLLASGKPLEAALIAGTAIGGPRAVQAGYNAAPIQNYLRNQLIPPQQNTSMMRALLAKITAAQEIGDLNQDFQMQKALQQSRKSKRSIYDDGRS